MNNNVINSICEDCKNLMTDFYAFKISAKQNLPMPKCFDYLKEFLNSNHSDPIVKITENQFIVSFENSEEYPQEEEYTIDEVEEVHEEAFQVDQDESMAIEDEVMSGFELESMQDDSCDLDDEDFESQVKSPDSITCKDEDAEFLVAVKSNYRCECGTELASVQELTKHMSQHKRKPGKLNFSCHEKSCDVDFKDQKFLEIHEKAHENFKAIAIHLSSHVCSECRKMFATEDDLTTHWAQHEDGGELLTQCTSIDGRSAYDDHMLKKIINHEEDDEVDNEDYVSCGYCNRKTEELEMKIHLLFFHTHIVFCPLDNRCFEGFKQVRLFSEHIRNKHPEIFEKSNLYACRHCNSSFESHFEKLAHMKQCGAKLYACEGHCNKRFATEWLLKLHKRQIQGIDRFTCDVCKKVCVSKSDLQIHNRSHTNERPYECTICYKSFKTSANRASHMDIHETQKRHACEICGKR